MDIFRSDNGNDPSLRWAYVGGPLDGRRDGDLPIIFAGRKMTGTTCNVPLSDLHGTGLYAVYKCTSETQINGYWIFEYVHQIGPGSTIRPVAAARTAEHGAHEAPTS